MPLINTMIIDIKLQAVNPKKTKVILDGGFNTKPGFIGFLMKSPFKKKLTDMLIGLKYYLETGNQVSKKNLQTYFQKVPKTGTESIFLKLK